jgi:hypothetical protein
MHTPILAVTVLALAGGAFAVAVATPEKPDLPPDTLAKIATHVVVGEVRQIWSRGETGSGWKTQRFVAEIAIERVEEGTADLCPGELVYVRYWHRRWIGPGSGPDDTTGHRGRPDEGDRVRVYLARDAYDGFWRTDDHGYNVVGANGFAML